jgi:hypothetical protein
MLLELVKQSLIVLGCTRIIGLRHVEKVIKESHYEWRIR